MTHRVDLYAQQVVDGGIVAGPLVRLACQRHLDWRLAGERKSGHPKGFWFSTQAADLIVDFFEQSLRLPDTLDDETGEPVPFLLTPANTFIVGSIFGWMQPRTVSGMAYRLIRDAYVEEGKGNAKTPLAAGIGLFGLTMDGEQAAEVYSVATGMEQARICWRDADRMVEASPELRELIYRGKDTLSYAATYSWFRPLTKEKRGKSGPRPHIVIFDEEHEYADAVVVNKMRAGMKRRKQPLSLGITNSGFDRTSVCWQHHEHARKALEGVVEDDQLFAYVCALDEGDDPFIDKTCHIKANPNLGIVVTQQYLDRQVLNAQHIPSEHDTVLRLNFCVWTMARTQAIDMKLWQACQPLPTEAELDAAPLKIGGLDLGQTDDFSAFARLYFLADGRVGVKMRFWLPESALEKYPNRPYAQWKREGLLTVTEGPSTDYDHVEQDVREDCLQEGIHSVAYDKRFADQMAQHLLGDSIQMVEQPQGFQLTEAIKRKGALIATGHLCHGYTDILTWMASNYVLRHGMRGEVRPDKDKAADKIDGQVAIDMALAVWVRQPAKIEPKYQLLVIGAGGVS
jgi:phage terminase large subunit-like protein